MNHIAARIPMGMVSMLLEQISAYRNVNGGNASFRNLGLIGKGKGNTGLIEAGVFITPLLATWIIDYYAST